MYTLYYSPGTASMVVHAALLEIGAAYRLEPVDFESGAQRSAEYLRLNPEGVVPTLVVDGRPVVESAALLLLLAERHPEAGLAPAVGSPDRAAWIQWIVYLANNLGPAFRLWFYPGDLGSAGDSHPVREALRGRIEAIWERLDGHLASGGPYLLGERFSAADLLLAMYMRWSRNMPRPATRSPALGALADRIRARPAWQRVNEIEGLTGW